MLFSESKLKLVLINIAGAFSILFALLTPFLRCLRMHWGANKDDIQLDLPGDDYLDSCNWSYTQAITIHAPSTSVWSWLAQIGQGRGGFYSYEMLENTVGCDIHNANEIKPALQDITIGDKIKLHPEMPGMPVHILEKDKSLVILADSRIGGSPVPVETKENNYFVATWGFYFLDIDNNTSRFISRYRCEYPSSFKNHLYYGKYTVEPISEIMQIQMLKGIKKRAEFYANVKNKRER